MSMFSQGMLMLLLLLSGMSHATSLPTQVIHLDRAWFIDSQASQPPAITAPGWRQVRLPDTWHKTHANDSFPAWYRLDFEINPAAIAADELWAVYIPAINSNGVFWLNREKIGDGGRMHGIVASNWHRPLYFNINRGQLKTGVNHLFIRFTPKHSGYGYLWPLKIGPDTQLRPAYRQLLFFKQTLVGVSSILLSAFAVFLGILWLMRRKDTLYGWFAAGCLAWAFFVFDMYVQHPLLPERLWDTLVFASVGWMVIFMSFFFHRFYNIPRPHLEPAMLAFGIIGTLALYLAGDRYFYFFSSFIWDNLLITFSLYIIWVIVSQSIKQPSLDNWLLSLSAALVVAFGGHDNLVQMGILGFDHMHFLPYGAPFLVGVLIWMLNKRFSDALAEAENLNRELDQRVDKKHRQLKTYYQHIRRFEKERILAEERERLMRDMHDGIGGHLVSALALSEHNDKVPRVLQITLQEALDDMRLMIDSLDSVDDDLLAVLGMFRSRMEERLAYAGIRIQWQVHDLPPVKGLGPEKVLNLLRILQEVVTNIIRHAHADCISFSTGLRSVDNAKEQIFIEICDNGRGFSDKPTKGHGLQNIEYRANAIKARLELSNAAEGGACIRILLPMDLSNENQPRRKRPAEPGQGLGEGRTG